MELRLAVLVDLDSSTPRGRRNAIARLASHPNTDRNRLKRFEPLWPVLAFTPSSRCPHGVVIHRNRICMVCSRAAKSTQAEIDQTNPPAPENPEDRAVRMIAFFRQWLENHRDADTRTKLHIMKQIYRLEAEVNEWIQPTRYRPDPKLKGGK